MMSGEVKQWGNTGSGKFGHKSLKHSLQTKHYIPGGIIKELQDARVAISSRYSFNITVWLMRNTPTVHTE